MDDGLAVPDSSDVPTVGHRSAGRRFGAVATTLVAGVALAGLVAGAVHGVRSAAALASSTQVASAAEDDDYYACLTTQAHHLVRPGQVVEIDRDDLSSWATLGKVVAPWAVVTTDIHRAAAVLSLREVTGGASCLGVVVVARYADGVVRDGWGATLPGRGPPPATPL